MSSIVSVDEILGCPTTPQSLDDFSVSSPSSFMSSRHASPCGSYMSSETSPSSVASPPPEDVKIKSEPEVKVKTEPEQKPVKKRKSWGQQLPTPTTNLPPRKRAKTAEEKEQRRVERVLRNRAAAQKSREVKKQQLEAIESERDMLKQKFESLVEENTKLAASNNHLLAQLKKIQEENARLMLHSNQPPPPVTEEPSSFDTLFMDCYGVDPNTTVTYPDSAHDDDSVLSESPCMTHQPAELVCDLPCLQGTFPMISLPLMTLVMGLVCFILSLISRIGTPLSQLLPSQYWMSFSTATSCARRLKTSPICSDVLARLRAATDGNSQRTTSGVERRSVASLILHSLERSQGCGVTQHSRGVTKYSPDAIEYSRGHSFHWAVGGLCGLG